MPRKRKFDEITSDTIDKEKLLTPLISRDLAQMVLGYAQPGFILEDFEQWDKLWNKAKEKKTDSTQWETLLPPIHQFFPKDMYCVDFPTLLSLELLWDFLLEKYPEKANEGLDNRYRVAEIPLHERECLFHRMWECGSNLFIQDWDEQTWHESFSHCFDEFPEAETNDMSSNFQPLKKRSLVFQTVYIHRLRGSKRLIGVSELLDSSFPLFYGHLGVSFLLFILITTSYKRRSLTTEQFTLQTNLRTEYLLSPILKLKLQAWSTLKPGWDSFIWDFSFIKDVRAKMSLSLLNHGTLCCQCQ